MTANGIKIGSMARNQLEPGQRLQDTMPAQSRSTLFSLSAPLILGLLLVMSCAHDCAGYSVLTHEAIIDAAWDQDIAPILLRRFPNTTAEELHNAHAYAYGGAIIQDLGYYPFGSKFFSDLTHYARSGDFVLALIEESAFIGYLVAGISGASAAALGIFLPVYLVVVVLAPSYKRWAKNPQINAFVRGVTAAATGAIAGAVIVLAETLCVRRVHHPDLPDHFASVVSMEGTGTSPDRVRCSRRPAGSPCIRDSELFCVAGRRAEEVLSIQRVTKVKKRRLSIEVTSPFHQKLPQTDLPGPSSWCNRLIATSCLPNLKRSCV